MTVAEILNSVKFVVSPDGHQSAVLVFPSARRRRRWRSPPLDGRFSCCLVGGICAQGNRLIVLYPGPHPYPLAERISAIPLAELVDRQSDLFAAM